MFNKKDNEIYITTLLILILLINGLILPYFYYKIFMKLADSRSRVLNYNYFKKNEIKYSIKTSKGLFLSFLFFGFSWLSYFGAMLAKSYHFNLIPQTMYLYMLLFSRTNSVFNPILYYTTNSLFKNGLIKLFSRMPKRIQNRSEKPVLL
jgi:hypothetical protein